MKEASVGEWKGGEVRGGSGKGGGEREEGFCVSAIRSHFGSSEFFRPVLLVW